MVVVLSTQTIISILDYKINSATRPIVTGSVDYYSEVSQVLERIVWRSDYTAKLNSVYGGCIKHYRSTTTSQ